LKDVSITGCWRDRKTSLQVGVHGEASQGTVLLEIFRQMKAVSSIVAEKLTLEAIFAG